MLAMLTTVVVAVQSSVELLSLHVVIVHLADSASHPVWVATIVGLELADSNLVVGFGIRVWQTHNVSPPPPFAPSPQGI